MSEWNYPNDLDEDEWDEEGLGDEDEGGCPVCGARPGQSCFCFTVCPGGCGYLCMDCHCFFDDPSDRPYEPFANPGGYVED